MLYVLHIHGFCAIAHLDDHKNTALHIAAYEGDYEKLELILHHYDLKINALNARRMTALFVSIRTPVPGFHLQRVQEILIQFKANVNVQNHKGYTCLHEACLLDNLKLVELLLSNRAKVYVLDKKSKTPIEYINHRVSYNKISILVLSGWLDSLCNGALSMGILICLQLIYVPL